MKKRSHKKRRDFTVSPAARADVLRAVNDFLDEVDGVLDEDLWADPDAIAALSDSDLVLKADELYRRLNEKLARISHVGFIKRIYDK